MQFRITLIVSAGEQISHSATHFLQFPTNLKTQRVTENAMFPFNIATPISIVASFDKYSLCVLQDL